jgi:fatty-acyl-CoA synthase
VPAALDETTIAGLLAARAGDDRLGLLFEDAAWSWDDVVRESALRASILLDRRRPGPFHLGVLLDNVPDYLFWLGGAALAGAAVVGINPTRRGAELENDIRHTDCQLIVTDSEGLDLLDGLDVPPTLALDGDEYPELLDKHRGAALPDEAVDPADLLLLLFTSGTTGAPKAVRCTQGRLARIGMSVVEQRGYFGAGDVCYCSMPLFHGNALMALWAPALYAAATVALPTGRKFSASGFLPDVRRHQATFFTYVGKALTYILATPEQDDDADNPLVRGFGNEASERDVERFQRRFGCRLVEGYGMSEGGATVARVPDMPPGALGVGPDGVCVMDPATGDECPRARFDERGRLLNAEQAIGEIVNKQGAAGFEGYYNNPEAEAERIRNGWYWTGDLGYRDEAGFFYFAGRSADWLRVDGENFAAAPVERILLRFPGVVQAGVYAVPDEMAGDQVMAALDLADGVDFDAAAFEAFLADQPDLGTKWAPRFVRIAAEMPLTASNKLMKKPLRDERWDCDEPVWWRPDRRGTGFRLMTDDDRAALRAEFEAHGRGGVLLR